MIHSNEVLSFIKDMLTNRTLIHCTNSSQHYTHSSYIILCTVIYWLIAVVFTVAALG